AAAPFNDFVAVSNSTVTITAESSTTATISITVNGDSKNENDESYSVNISAPANKASVTRATGNATITNDDPPPNVFIADVTMNQGDSGSPTVNIPVTLLIPSGQPGAGNPTASGMVVTVPYTIGGGTATLGTDYMAPTSGTLTFTEPSMTQNIQVSFVGDLINEADENFIITLGTPTNATLLPKSTAVVTIKNDDPPPLLSINDISVTEGNGGPGSTQATFTLTLSSPGGGRPAFSGRDITVTYSTADGTARATPVAGAKNIDYTPVTNGTATI